MSVLFEVKSYDGKRIRLTQVQWLHTVFFHPEVGGEQDKIKHVLKEPEVVVEGAQLLTRGFVTECLGQLLFLENTLPFWSKFSMEKGLL